MLRASFILFFFCFISACGQNKIPDDKKFSELERRCKDFSSESIVENSADGAVNLSATGYSSGLSGKLPLRDQLIVLSTFHYPNEPLGFAKLPALDLEYSPAYLLKTLFMGPDKLSEVYYSGMKATTTRKLECPDGKKVLVRTPEESDATFLNVCDPSRMLDSTQYARYTVNYAYGNLDEYDIRPFLFWVNDRTNGRVLAEQRSFQLLLGGMIEKSNQALLAWGGAQGVKTCGLTPPDQVIKRVIR
jgi:hypothetical protein